MIKKISVSIPANKALTYPVLIGVGLLNHPTWIPKNYSKIVVVTDNNVKKHYAKRFMALLKNNGYEVILLAFPSGERYKNIRTKNKLEEEMLKQLCDRDTLILALGGGVVGDVAGFVAATYMRGIAFIQIPTTMLAMVDSSIGGKTGIDTPQGKNLIGAYWQPKAVIADISCLHTLPKKHLVNGLIEALKVFLIQDAKSFNYFKNNLEAILDGNKMILTNIVKKAATIKINVVQKDERENNLRAILNFGHTIGHALELVSNYKLLHGYAVAYGILVEAKMAELMGILSSQNFLIIEAILNALHISSKHLKKWDVNKIIEATSLDKKSKNKKVNYVLLKNIGDIYRYNNSYVHSVSKRTVKKAFLMLGASSYGR